MEIADGLLVAQVSNWFPNHPFLKPVRGCREEDRQCNNREAGLGASHLDTDVLVPSQHILWGHMQEALGWEIMHPKNDVERHVHCREMGSHLRGSNGIQLKGLGSAAHH